MLTVEEKKELRLYKQRTLAFLGLWSFSILLFAPMALYFVDSSLRIHLFYILLSINILSLIVEWLLLWWMERAFVFMLSMFNGFNMLYACNMLLLGLVFNNRTVLYWDPLTNIIILVMLVLIFIAAQLFEYSHWNTVVGLLEEKGMINNEEGIYDIWKERDSKIYPKMNIWAGFILVWSACGFSYLIYRQYHHIGWHAFKEIFAGFAAMMLGPWMLFEFSRYLCRAFMVLNWEKKNGKKLFTGLIKYIRRENEINELRKQKGLKPVEIKSMFFTGHVDK